MTLQEKPEKGFLKVICQRALEIEMQFAGIKCIREFEMPVFYRNYQIGTGRVDFFVKRKLALSQTL